MLDDNMEVFEVWRLLMLDDDAWSESGFKLLEGAELSFSCSPPFFLMWKRRGDNKPEWRLLLKVEEGSVAAAGDVVKPSVLVLDLSAFATLMFSIGNFVAMTS